MGAFRFLEDSMARVLKSAKLRGACDWIGYYLEEQRHVKRDRDTRWHVLNDTAHIFQTRATIPRSVFGEGVLAF